MEVDGRFVNTDLYPAGFNFNLIRGAIIGRNTPIYNYNNMVMDVHIVDENQFVNKRKVITKEDLYGPPWEQYKENTNIKFLS